MSSRQEARNGWIYTYVTTDAGWDIAVSRYVGDVQSTTIQVEKGPCVRLSCADAIAVGDAIRKGADAPNHHDAGYRKGVEAGADLRDILERQRDAVIKQRDRALQQRDAAEARLANIRNGLLGVLDDRG